MFWFNTDGSRCLKESTESGCSNFFRLFCAFLVISAALFYIAHSKRQQWKGSMLKDISKNIPQQHLWFTENDVETIIDLFFPTKFRAYLIIVSYHSSSPRLWAETIKGVNYAVGAGSFSLAEAHQTWAHSVGMEGERSRKLGDKRGLGPGTQVGPE